MIFNKVIIAGALLISGTICAHNFDHFEIEELKDLAAKQHKVIATQKEIIQILEEEVHHLKHEIRKESAYHELKKLLKSLGF